MYRLLFILLCYSISGSSSGAVLEPEVVVMLAFPKEAKISDKSCHDFLTKEERRKGTVCLDGVIELKYEVDEVLYGQYDAELIDIVDFYHASGFPAYLQEYPAYFTLVKENGHYFLSQDARFIGIGTQAFVCGKRLNPKVADDSTYAPTYQKIDEKQCQFGVEFETLKQYFKNAHWDRASIQ